MDQHDKQSYAQWLQEGNSVFQQCQLPRNLADALREWHRLAWFTDQGPDTRYIHNAGLKPGGPIADIMFALFIVSTTNTFVGGGEGTLLTLVYNLGTALSPHRKVLLFIASVSRVL